MIRTPKTRKIVGTPPKKPVSFVHVLIPVPLTTYNQSATGLYIGNAQSIHFEIREASGDLLVDFADTTSTSALGYIAVKKDKFLGFLYGLTSIVYGYINVYDPQETPTTITAVSNFEGTMDFVSGGAANPPAPLPGTGDVLGPASSIDSHPALFSGTSGRVLKDTSGVIFTGSGNVNLYSGTLFTSGGSFNGKTISLAGTTDAISLSAPATITTPYGLVLPADPPTNNQTLVSDAFGNLSWATPGGSGSGTGDVVGPASSTTNRPAVFASGTGKTIKEVPYTIPTADGTAGQVLATDGAGAVSWKTLISSTYYSSPTMLLGDTTVAFPATAIPMQSFFINTSVSITMAANPFTGTPPNNGSEVTLAVLPGAVGNVMVSPSATLIMNGAAILVSGKTITFIVTPGPKYVEKCRS